MPNNDIDTSENAVAPLESVTNPSEYLNDEYEHPYTTLLADNYAVDEHVYLTTKTNSINDNSMTFQNAAYEHTFTSRETKYSEDTQKTHISASNGQENETLDYLKNNLTDPDEDAHPIKVNSQKNATEYINLSLNQWKKWTCWYVYHVYVSNPNIALIDPILFAFDFSQTILKTIFVMADFFLQLSQFTKDRYPKTVLGSK